MVAAAQGARHGAAARRRRPQLAYALPDFGITMPFKPTDFTQVNPHINRVLVSRACACWMHSRTSA
jgi:tRNA/tmRNA/rRNA uracil-C5-methylase (TrmA/RlmC/RlmD family)